MPKTHCRISEAETQSAATPKIEAARTEHFKQCREAPNTIRRFPRPRHKQRRVHKHNHRTPTSVQGVPRGHKHNHQISKAPTQSAMRPQTQSANIETLKESCNVSDTNSGFPSPRHIQRRGAKRNQRRPTRARNVGMPQIINTAFPRHRYNQRRCPKENQRRRTHARNVARPQTHSPDVRGPDTFSG